MLQKTALNPLHEPVKEVYSNQNLLEELLLKIPSMNGLMFTMQNYQQQNTLGTGLSYVNDFSTSNTFKFSLKVKL